MTLSFLLSSCQTIGVLRLADKVLELLLFWLHLTNVVISVPEHFSFSLFPRWAWAWAEAEGRAAPAARPVAALVLRRWL